MKRFLFALSLALGAGAFSGCTTVPETGRRQIMLISPAEEAQMGLAAFAQIKSEETISTNPQANARIERIGRRIAAAVGRDLPNAQWEFVVFDSDQVNAFALPGGKVGVYTGLLKLADSDDEIATVMGHEIAHVSSRHGGERMSQQMVAGLGGAAIGATLNDDKNRDLYLAAYTGVATLGTLAYSRHHESEADAVGLRYAAGAGYDPRAAITFWKKMAAQKQGGGTFELLSTHPSDERRIRDLEALAPQYMALYEANRARYE